MGVFSFSLGLDPKKWSAREIRKIVLDLAELLSKYQDEILPKEAKLYDREILVEKFTKINEVIKGFQYQKRGRKEDE